MVLVPPSPNVHAQVEAFVLWSVKATDKRLGTAENAALLVTKVAVTGTAAEQFCASNTCREKIVVAVGPAIGFGTVGELRTFCGAQEYANGAVPPIPLGFPPNWMESPAQKSTFAPASAMSKGA